jgi:hypothetical protein
MLKQENVTVSAEDLLLIKEFSAGLRAVKGQVPVKKADNYINLGAAYVLLKNGINPDTKYGVPLSKAVSDYTGGDAWLTDNLTWNRDDLMTGARAKQFWDATFQYAPAFLSNITMITDADELTYPIDIFGDIGENLISSVRAGTQPTAAQIKNIYGIVGKELFGEHTELQFNLKTMEIVNKLYNTGFASFLAEKIGKMWTEDLLRLWTNGTSADYSGVSFSTFVRSDMYKLNYGWEYLLQNLYGLWTNSNKNAIVIGPFGNLVTPNRVAVSDVGNVTKQSYSLAATEEGFTVVSDAAVAITGTYLATTTSGANGYSQNTTLIDFGSYSRGYVTIHYKMSAADSGRIQVIDSAGTVLSDAGILSATTDTVVTLWFNTDAKRYINLRFTGIGSGDVMNTKTVAIVKVISSIDGWDMQDYMDLLIEALPEKYKGNPNYKFIMSGEDRDKYADSRSAGHRSFDSNPINQNTETRENYLSTGTIPPYKGYGILYHPYKHSISKTKSYGGVSQYGSIIFCDPKDLFAMVVNNVEKDIKKESRMGTGGSGLEFTYQSFTDAQIGLGEKICVAYNGAQCEIPIMMSDGKVKSTQLTTAMAAGSIYPYCDTTGVRIFIASDANAYAELATIDTAIAGAVAATACWELVEGDAHALTADSYKIVSFKDGVLLRSDLSVELVVT